MPYYCLFLELQIPFILCSALQMLNSKYRSTYIFWGSLVADNTGKHNRFSVVKSDFFSWGIVLCFQKNALVFFRFISFYQKTDDIWDIFDILFLLY